MPEDALAQYDIDRCLTTSEAPSFLTSANLPKEIAYAIPEYVSQDITFLSYSTVDLENLKPAIDECRVTKDEYEVALIRKANKVSAIAHKACTDLIRQSPRPKSERDFQAIFTSHCIALNCQHQAYSGIFASGTNAATLHYVHNDQPIEGRQNILIDAGAEELCYASDVTRTLPLTGTFTPESKAIYELVEKMQSGAFAMCKANMTWDSVHAETHRIAIRGLLKLGILHGGSESEIFDARTSVAFFPHGLGHYLGLDTHDTGGHADYEDEDPMFRYLRVRGKVPAGAVITVEPGIYFCEFILRPYLEDGEGMGRFIDKAVLERYWAVGGVRIEDDILVTEDGFENLTTAEKGVWL
ncbi:MAG: hypothetical protein LQ340_001622 [Diploschistes diacapsis]|nr:MAG: hypothetical protein LQ340_001622 [Diploschistes diacapsis]